MICYYLEISVKAMYNIRKFMNIRILEPYICKSKRDHPLTGDEQL